MSSFLKSAFQLRKTERPALPVDGNIPRVLEEPWATLGPWQEAQHRMHNAATAPASQLKAGRETREDFPGFAAAGRTNNAPADINPTCHFREMFGKKCMSLAEVKKEKLEVLAFMGFGNS